ncbi:MAG: hypothetical protein L3J36_08510 [Rhodobacteraceae bacterium]|nr:hypothetical protein [Paracoccaceae bacterium]
MRFIKQIFGWLFKALAALAILIAVLFAVLAFVSRQERAIAKEFVSLVGQDLYADAHAMFSEELQQEYPVELMKSQLSRSQVYTKISFNNINWKNGKLRLSGLASTEDDCTSPVVFVFVEEMITGFQFGSPCMTDEQST